MLSQRGRIQYVHTSPFWARRMWCNMFEIERSVNKSIFVIREPIKSNWLQSEWTNLELHEIILVTALTAWVSCLFSCTYFHFRFQRFIILCSLPPVLCCASAYCHCPLCLVNFPVSVCLCLCALSFHCQFAVSPSVPSFCPSPVFNQDLDLACDHDVLKQGDKMWYSNTGWLYGLFSLRWKTTGIPTL